jgi:hypothetical protein
MTMTLDGQGGMARLQELVDRADILDCVQRYARGIDRHDVELVASCYHPDAIDDHGLYVGPGRVWPNGPMTRPTPEFPAISTT